MALFGVSVMVGPVLGPVIGGWLTDNISWRWVFYIKSRPRRRRLCRRQRLRHRNPRPARHPARLARLRRPQRRHRRPPALPRPWRAARLVLLRRNHDRGAGRRRGVLCLPGPHLHRPHALREPAPVPGPQLHPRHGLHLHRRCHLPRIAGPDDALPANADGLPGRHCRAGHGPARHRHDGVHVRGRQTDRPGRNPLAAAARPRPDCVGDVRHDRLDPRRLAIDHRRHRLHPGRRPRLPVRAALGGHLLHPALYLPRRRDRALQPVPATSAPASASPWSRPCLRKISRSTTPISPPSLPPSTQCCVPRQ